VVVRLPDLSVVALPATAAALVKSLARCRPRHELAANERCCGAKASIELAKRGVSDDG